MQELRLFAISIDAVRDIFGADAPLAAHLRQVAARHFAPAPRPRSIVDRVGPLFARQPSTQIDRRNPTSADVDSLLAGGHIPPDRLSPCWRLLLVWLEDLAPHHSTIRVDALDQLEFDLARAGLPSDFSLRHLARRELGTALRPMPDQIVGYSKHVHVVETHRHLSMLTGGATPVSMLTGGATPEFASTMAAVAPLLDLLGGIASPAGRGLDLVVVQPPS
ncbi:hypothetical protein [Tessaracoccus sp.]